MTPESRPIDPTFNLRDVVGDADVGDAMSAFSRLRFQHQRLLDALGHRIGISASDIRVLFYLAASSEVTPKAAAEFLGVTTGAMTSLVDRNERADLMRRAPHPHDRRSVILELTESGRATVDVWAAEYRAAFSVAIPADRIAELTDTFEHLAGELAQRADHAEKSASPSR